MLFKYVFVAVLSHTLTIILADVLHAAILWNPALKSRQHYLTLQLDFTSLLDAVNQLETMTSNMKNLWNSQNLLTIDNSYSYTENFFATNMSYMHCVPFINKS